MESSSSPTPHAFTERLLAEQGQLRRLAFELAGNEAEDATQDAWVAALTHPPRSEATLAGWLRRVLRNRSIDQARRRDRRRWREEHAALPESIPSAAEVEERMELIRQVGEAVRALPEPQRRAIYLRYFEEKLPAEIARSLGLSKATVATRLARGRELLRAKLDRDFGGERGNWAIAALTLGGSRSTQTLPIAAPLLGVGTLTMKKTLACVGLVTVLGTTLFVVQPWKSPSPIESTAQENRSAPKIVAPSADRDEPTEPSVASVGGETPTRQALPATATRAATGLGGIRGRVFFASDGAPASGLRGQLERTGEAPEIERGVVLDEQGAFEAQELPEGEWMLRLFGYANWIVSVAADETTPFEARIQPGLNVLGRVLDVDGRPVAQAEIFFDEDADRIGQRIVTISDVEGRFFIRDLAPWDNAGPYTQLAARKGGHVTSGVWEARGAPGDTHRPVLRLLGRAARLSGFVRTPSGAGVPQARVAVASVRRFQGGVVDEEGYSLKNPPSIRLTCDTKGYFSTDRAAPGSRPVNVRAPDFVPGGQNVQLTSGQETEISIELTLGGAISGVVVKEDGTPAPEVTVGATPAPWYGTSSGPRLRSLTSTDADGRYRLSGLDFEEFVVTASHRQEGRATGRVSLDPGTPGIDALWNAELQRLPPGLTGVLLDADEEPLEGWWICASRKERPGLWHANSTTDAAGHFALNPLPDGEWMIEVRLPEPFASAPILTIPFPSEPHVRWIVPAGTTPNAFVIGRVLDTAGSPLMNSEVSIRDSAWTFYETAYPDRDSGSFRIGPLVAGQYEITASAPGFVDSDWIAVTLEGSAELDTGSIELVEGGLLHVELEEGSAPAQHFELLRDDDASIEHLTVQEGVARSSSLRPGFYRLSTSGPDTAYWEMPVEIRVGGMQRLSVRLDTGTQRAFHWSRNAGTEENFKLEVFQPDGTAFAGRILISSDETLAKARVYGLTPGTWRGVLTSSSGRELDFTFVVEDLEPPEEPTLLDV